MSNTTTTTHHTATHSHSMRFETVGLEVLSAVIHLFGVSVLAFLLAKKLHWSDLSSPQAMARISWPRLLVILTIFDSWLFLFSTGLLVNGTGMELSETVCLLGILNCIIFYASSKILIYLFLVEKVYVVWGGAARKRRLQSPVYLVCMGVVALYVGVAIFLILGRISYFRDDGSCVIGLTRPASLTLLIYDLFVNVFLTSLFVWPLFNQRFNIPRLRRVALRTLWAAAVALTTSCINILILTIMHGKQLGWVCLASCGSDVVINAVVLSWVTSGGGSSQNNSSYEGPDTSAKPLDSSNIIDCSQISETDKYRRMSAVSTFSRRRALSEPPRPNFRARIHRLSRLFEPRIAEADPDIEHAGDHHVVVVVREEDDEYAQESEDSEDREKDAADEAEKEHHRGVVEGMYKHASASRSLLPQPVQAYKSMLKRSDQSLRQHLNESQVEIQVVQETRIVRDDVPPPRAPKVRRWQIRHRSGDSPRGSNAIKEDE
ncbi:hypothetical protein VTO73DRAFT_6651 [Trametes versicolor]